MSLKKLIKFSLYSLASLLLAGAFHLSYIYVHRTFSVQAFKHPALLSGLFTQLSPKEEIGPILSQKFYYLGEGRQMTAFESEDHNYVIKFFHPWTKPRSYTSYSFKKIKKLLFPKTLGITYLNREKRLYELAKCYHMIFQEFPEDESLIFVYLNDSYVLPEKLILEDKNKVKHQIDLKKTPFILQKKAVLATVYFEQLLKRGDSLGIQEALLALNHLFEARAKKGLWDKGQALGSNYGFIHHKAVQIDWGMIKKDPNIANSPEKERQKITQKAAAYLMDFYPNLEPFIFNLTESP